MVSYSRQKRWLGHILRHDSLLRITLEGQIQGKKVIRETKNNALGLASLATEDGGRQYLLRRTKDPGQIKRESMNALILYRPRRFINHLLTYLLTYLRWKSAIWQNTAERDNRHSRVQRHTTHYRSFQGRFLPRDAMHSADYAFARCSSVCPFVCLSRAVLCRNG